MKKDSEQLQAIKVSLYIIIVLLIIITITLFVTNANSDGKSNTSNNNSSETNSDYDVSMMESADISQVLGYFEDGSKKLIYVGRSSCSACIAFLPNLQQAQSEYGYKTVNLDTDTVVTSSDEYKKFVEKLDMEYTLVNNGESETGEFGSFFGYTPTLIVIENGKQVDGFIGYMEYDELTAFLDKNGF